MDYFSKWLEVYTIPNPEANTIVNAFVNNSNGDALPTVTRNGRTVTRTLEEYLRKVVSEQQKERYDMVWTDMIVQQIYGT